MTSNFNSKEDQEEFFKAFGNFIELFGNEKKLVAGNFMKRLGYVQSHPEGFVNDKVNDVEPGKSGFIGENPDGQMYLEFRNSNNGNNEQTLHYMRHEMMHIFETVLHDTFCINENTKFNALGIPQLSTRMIGNSEYAVMQSEIFKKMNANESVNARYGKAFNEILTDMIAIVSKVSFDGQYKEQSITADTVLKQPIENWNINELTTGYFSSWPFGRLMISAFSNFPDVSYQELIENGNGIYYKTNDDTGERKIVNDFIYGCTCNPFHIMEEYDKIAGQSGYYFRLCERVDRIFNSLAYKKEYNIEEINDIISEIDMIAKRRIQIKVSNGELTLEEGTRMLEDFEMTKSSVEQEFTNVLSNARSM